MNNFWQPISTLDKTKMQFVLIADDGAVRVQLWDDVRKRWEHPFPFGSEVQSGETGFNPEYWAPIPHVPERDLI